MVIFRFVLVVALGLAFSGPGTCEEKSTSLKPPAPDVKIGEKIRTSYCFGVIRERDNGFRAELFQMAMTLERINTLLEVQMWRNGGGAGQLPYYPNGGGGVYPTPAPFPAGGAPVAAAESGLNNIALQLLLQGQGELLGAIDRGRPVSELRQQLTDIQRQIDRLGLPGCRDCQPRPIPYQERPLGLQLQLQGEGVIGSYRDRKTTTTYPKEKK